MIIYRDENGRPLTARRASPVPQVGGTVDTYERGSMVVILTECVVAPMPGVEGEHRVTLGRGKRAEVDAFSFVLCDDGELRPGDDNYIQGDDGVWRKH